MHQGSLEYFSVPGPNRHSVWISGCGRISDQHGRIQRVDARVQGAMDDGNGIVSLCALLVYTSVMPIFRREKPIHKAAAKKTTKEA